MCLPANGANEVWRIIVLRRHASELLALRNENGYALPRLDILRGNRVARALTDQLKKAWELDAFALYPLLPDASSPCGAARRVHAVEAVQYDAAAPTGAEWIPFSAAEQLRFAESDDLAAVRALQEDLPRTAASGDSASVGCPGTLPRIRSWVEQALEPFGLNIGTSFCQLTAGKRFGLIRFETGGGGVWFKAVGEPNLHEFPISRQLAATLPAFVPRILAAREDWNAWVTLEFEGCHPDENSPLDTWIDIATTFADLQIASIGKTFLFIDAGCRNIRVPTLAKAVAPYLQAAAELMDEQTKNSPPPMNQEEINTLETILLEALTHLENLHLPDTLGHLDFNPGNILVNGHRVVFLDWAAAGVGCPFITIEYLLERLCRLRPLLQASWRNEVLSAYLHRYRFLLRPQELAAALTATPLIAVFAYAVASGAWRDPGRRRDPETAAHLRSLTRRMHREAQLWISSSGSRSLCRRLG